MCNDRTNLDYNPFGFALGLLTTYAEPAVRVLSDQIETSSNGYIRGSCLPYALSFAVGVSVSIGMIKIIYGFSFVPIIALDTYLCLSSSISSDPDFIGIAFDSGGFGHRSDVSYFSDGIRGRCR